MAENVVQLASEQKFETMDKASLLMRLDELLEKYLNTLDLYQNARQQLTTQLTSGYLSLAQANFNNQSRSRYGQDYYDERMQALKTISLDVDDSAVTFALSSGDPPPRQSASESQSSADSQITSSESQTTEFARNGTTEADNASVDASKMPGDPLRWFGILVPTALRSAQASFATAVEGSIPQLATLTKDLRRQEGDIGRLRKQIRKL